MTLWLAEDGTLTGTVVVPIGSGEISATYDPATGEIEGQITTDDGTVAELRIRISGSTLSGTVTMEGMTIELEGERTSVGGAGGRATCCGRPACGPEACPN